MDCQAQRDFWKKLLQKRKRVEFSPAELQTLRQRERGNRLTIDQGSQRIEPGKSLSEVEREWLFQKLVEQYGIGAGPVHQGSGGSGTSS